MKRDQLKINEPCTEDWDSMHGKGGTRFCDKCTKNVHNLSEMTRGEAEEFLQNEAESNVCVIYRYDSRTGEVQFKADHACTTTRHARQLVGLKRLVAAAALVAPLASGCDTEPPPRDCSASETVRPIDIIMAQERELASFLNELFAPEPELVMGEVAYVPASNGAFDPAAAPAADRAPKVEPVQPVTPSVAPPEPVWEMGEVEFVPEPEDSPGPEIEAADWEIGPDSVDTKPVEHQIREQLDNDQVIPIRRVMGRIAPVRVQHPDETHEYFE